MAKKKKAPTKRARRVEKTRNGGTWTEAQFRSWIRSSLRRMSMRWRPIYNKFQSNKRLATAEDKSFWGNKIKYVHQCEHCLVWFPKKMVEVDHRIPAGSLVDIEKDAGPFLLRLLVEEDGLDLLCTVCHQEKTNKEKNDTNS